MIETELESVSTLSLTTADPVANPALGSSAVEMLVQSGLLPFSDVDSQLAPSEIKAVVKFDD